MSDRNVTLSAYDLVFSLPAMDFVARVGRSGKYTVPLMDEFLVRIIHSAESLSFNAVASLLRLTSDQLEAYLEPMLRASLLKITEDGLLSLGVRGEAAMAHASGDPPKLTKIEEASEWLRLDLADFRLCITPKDRRPTFGSIDIDPGEARSRTEIREFAHKALSTDYADHMAYLEGIGYRNTPAKDIEFVIDMDDGRGAQTEVNVNVQFDDTGRGILQFCDFRNDDQLRLRRQIVERVTALFRTMASICTPQSRRLFAMLVSEAGKRNAFDDTDGRFEQGRIAGEFWGARQSIVAGA